MCLEFNISTIPQMSCTCFPFIPPTSQTHSNQKIITVLKIIKLRKYKGKITFSVHMFWGNFFCAATNTDNTKRNQRPKDHRSDDEQLLSTKKITAWNKKQNVAWEKAYHKRRLRLLFCSDIASFNSVFSIPSFCISFSGSQRPIGSESRLFTGDDSADKSLLTLSLSLSLSE